MTMSWTTAEAEQAVLEFVSRELIGARDGPIDADQDLLGSGLVSSLGVMRLIRYLEERFAVTVPPADVTIENFIDARTIVAYVESLRREPAAAGHD